MKRGGVLGLGAIVGLAAAAAARHSERRPASSPATSTKRPTPAPAAPPLYAYLYQGNEIAVRMAIGTSPATAKEMGIFGSEAKALQVAKERGAIPAWKGVKQL